MERIALAREYQVVELLRDAYLELTRKKKLDFKELGPAEPNSNPLDRNWEADAKKWEATSRDWETLARISQVQLKVAIFLQPLYDERYRCRTCAVDYIVDECNSDGYLCKCRLLRMVDQAFQGELESLRENPEHVEHPLPRKLPILYLCPLKKQFCIAISTDFPKSDSALIPKRKKRKT
jgi:hypothetical protein